MQKISIRKSLNQKDYDLLVSLCQKYGVKKTHKKKEDILTFGESPTQLSLLVKGIIKYSIINDEGDEYVEEFITSGQIFGDIMANADRIGHTVVITAISRVEVMNLNFRLLYTALSAEEKSHIEHLFQTVINKMHIFFLEQAHDRSITPAEVRYLQLAEQEPEVVRHATAKDIASFLRISTEQLRRIKLKLQNSAER